MSFVRLVVFVVIDEKDEETVTQGLNEVLDGFVIRHLPIFDSGLTSTPVLSVENATEVLREIFESTDER
jgi:hypothetical protein